MKKPWENDSCEQVRGYYAYYTVPQAAMLWCGVPPNQVNDELAKAEPIAETNQYGLHVLRHPYIPCLEPRCRAIQDAINNGLLKVGRDGGDGDFISAYGSQGIAYSRRTVRGNDLKEWIAKVFPADKPAFLFDEIERRTHAAINADAFRALQADRDAARSELEKAKARTAEAIKDMETMRGERDSLRAMVDKANAPGGRSEKTYLNIIGGLLALMLGRSPAGKPQSSFENQSAIISAMLGHYGHIKGMGDSNLEKIMADANKTLKDSAISGG